MRITDFGIAKYFRANNAKETSGTPGYMAPEVMKAKNHSYTVDFFALGIIGYEFMLGRRPYNGPSRREIKEQMLSKNVEITFGEIPNGWSEDAADFFNKLLQRKPELRLGNKGIWELKQHRWMKYFPWDKLMNKELESPFIPPNADNFDHKYCNEIENQGLKTKERFAEIRMRDSYKTVFKDYLYFNRYDLNSNNNKSIYINIHESMYKDRGDNIDQRTNNINENYMSLRFLHYRNKSIKHILLICFTITISYTIFICINFFFPIIILWNQKWIHYFFLIRLMFIKTF